jgi:hypothetical membrane protein
LPINLDILETLLNNQKSAIKYQLVFAIIVVILGCCVLLIAFFSPYSADPNNPIRILLTIGGGFIASISVFPIKEITARKEKIKVYEFFKGSIGNMSTSNLKRTEEIIWKSIEKIA